MLARPLASMPKLARPTLIFPGGGIFFWWQAGAVSELARRFDLCHPRLHSVGASAGAISASFAACSVDVDRALDLAIDQCLQRDVFKRGAWGLCGVWGGMIDEWLETLLPPNAADECRTVDAGEYEDCEVEL